MTQTKHKKLTNKTQVKNNAIVTALDFHNDSETWTVRTKVNEKLFITYKDFRKKPTVNGQEIQVDQIIYRDSYLED